MKKKEQNKISEWNVVIASHIYATGPALDLEEYLKKKVKSLLFIGHPFADRPDKRSFYRSYIRGELIKNNKSLTWRIPGLFFHVKDAFYTIWWVMTNRGKVNLFIGSDNFMGYLGIILKKIGKVDQVILYTIDYMPQRFNNPVLNSLYHYFDSQCLRHCSIIWNVSAKIEEGRAEKTKNIRNAARQIVVPLGMWFDRVPKLSVDQKEKNTIVFMGHILEKQGLDMFVRSLPSISKEIKGVRCVVIGSGPYLQNLKKLASKLKVSKLIDFKGYVEDHHDVEKMLAKSTIAIAPYKPEPDSFTYFADPGKIKNYLAAGLPVVVTDVPPIAKTLELEMCGVICKYDASDISKKVTYLLKDKRKLSLYSDNAIKFARQFDWNVVFDKALQESI